jgi:hypothetical protein
MSPEILQIDCVGGDINALRLADSHGIESLALPPTTHH